MVLLCSGRRPTPEQDVLQVLRPWWPRRSQEIPHPNTARLSSCGKPRRQELRPCQGHPRHWKQSSRPVPGCSRENRSRRGGHWPLQATQCRASGRNERSVGTLVPAKRVPGSSHAGYLGMRRRYTITQLNMRRCAPEIDDLTLGVAATLKRHGITKRSFKREHDSVLIEVNCHEFRCLRRNEIVKSRGK